MAEVLVPICLVFGTLAITVALSESAPAPQRNVPLSSRILKRLKIYKVPGAEGGPEECETCSKSADGGWRRVHQSCQHCENIWAIHSVVVLPDGRHMVNGRLSFENEGCSICLEEMRPGEDVALLPCRHLFHSKCVFTWLIQNARCPCCIKDLDRVVYELEKQERRDRVEAAKSRKQAQKAMKAARKEMKRKAKLVSKQNIQISDAGGEKASNQTRNILAALSGTPKTSKKSKKCSNVLHAPAATVM